MNIFPRKGRVHTRARVSFVPVAAILAVTALLGACGGNSTPNTSPPPPPPPPPPPVSFAITGSVLNGSTPISGATVVAYAAGTRAGAAATQLGTNVTDSNGDFKIAFNPAPAAGQIVYLISIGGDAGAGMNAAIWLATVAGPYCTDGSCSFQDQVTINALTSAAVTGGSHHHGQFVDCSTIVNNSLSGTCVSVSGGSELNRLVATIGNLVDVKTGEASTFLTAQPATAANPIHATLERANTIASILAGCVGADVSTSPNACTKLFAKIGDDEHDAVEVTNTLVAAALMAIAPRVNDDGPGLFALLPETPVYAPTLATAPANWTIGGHRFAFVSNAAGSVSAYTVNPATGDLTPVTAGRAAPCFGPAGTSADANLGPPPDPMNCFAAGIAPAAITLTPNARFVYVANCDGNDISAYAVDPGTGALVAIPDSPFGGSPHPFSVQVDTTGQFLYASNIGASAPAEAIATRFGSVMTPRAAAARQGFVSVYAINSTSGALAPIAGSPFKAGDQTYAVALTDQFAYALNAGSNSVSAFSIDSTSGSLAPVPGTASCGAGMPDACFAAGAGVSRMTADPLGRFVYVANYDGNSLSAFAIDASSGALTAIPGTASCGTGLPSKCFASGINPVKPGMDPGGRFLYAANFGGDGSQGSVSAWTVDPSTGALEMVPGAPYPDPVGPIWVTVGPGGHFAFVVNFNNLTVVSAPIDPKTGALGDASFFPAGPGADAIAVGP